MTQSDSIGTARNQLRDAIAEFQSSPCITLTISPWVAMSLMQKAIRRGRTDLALQAAATLLHASPERLWRRLGCIAVEDVGVADLDIVAVVTTALAGKRCRENLGGEWHVASCIVSRMVQAPKCRAADDLLLAAENHPDFEDTRLAFAFRSTDDLIQIVTGADPLPIRALAAWYALGTDRRPSPVGMRVRVCVDRVSNRNRITNSQHHTPPIRSWGLSHVRWAILSYTAASAQFFVAATE
jgi:MgsA AAA+ ATPase C terminal